MKIVKVAGREIYDARGWPTIECEIMLEDGSYVTASVPTGTSRGAQEAYELRDGGSRLMGKGVSKAIENIENKIAPVLIGQEPDTISMDLAMIELDNTADKSQLGANAILAVSSAVLRAQATVENIEPYELIAYLCEYNSVTLPFALFNMISGGIHAASNVQFQEIMALPVGSQNFRECLEAAVTLSHVLEQILAAKGKPTAIGYEGAFISSFTDEYEALDTLMAAIEKTEEYTGAKFLIALDVAASHFYDRKNNRYRWHEKTMESEELVHYYSQLIKKYPIFSIEDGLSEVDYNGWALLMKTLSENVQIIGDDLLVTNAQKIATAVEQGIITGTVIKPTQIGTITETLQAIKLCKQQDLTCMVSHRSGETNDALIVDLVVGTSAGYIKAGGPRRGEHLVKYNELLRIEDVLMLGLLNA